MSMYSVFGPRVPLYSEAGEAATASYDPISFLTEQQQDEGEAHGMDLSNLYPRPDVPPPKSSARADASGGDSSGHRRAGSVTAKSAVGGGLDLDSPTESPTPGKSDHVAPVREASLDIIPLLLASPPSIPSGLKSAEVKQRHTLLSISPYDVEDYLVTTGPSIKRDTANEAITNLETLKAHVDQLAGIVATETSAMTTIIRSVKFLSPERGQLVASVDLGEYDSNPGLVSMILKAEDFDGSVTSLSDSAHKIAWRFHNLLPCGAARGQWVETPQEALNQHSEPDYETLPYGKMLSAGGAQFSRVRSGTSVGTARTADTFNTAHTTGPNEGDDPADASDEDDGKQQHFTEADDFWGGWDDDNEPKASEPAKPVTSEDSAKAEDDYWNSYDAQDPYDESQKRYAEEMKRQHSIELDTASQVGSVNFDNLERMARQDEIQDMPGDYFGNAAVENIRSLAPRRVPGGSVIDQSIPEERGREDDEHSVPQFGQGDTAVPLSFHRLNPSSSPATNGPGKTGVGSQATVSTGARTSSPGSDATDPDSGEDDNPDDEPAPAREAAEDTMSYDVTTVEGTEDERFSSAKGQNATTDRATAGDSTLQRDSRLGLKNGSASGTLDTAAERHNQDTSLGANRQSDGGTDPSRQALDDTERNGSTKLSPSGHRRANLPSGQSQDPSRSLPFAYHPPPMSVTGQSTFETPEDMTLADLEAFYRGRDQQRMIETRERILRLHQGIESDEGDIDDQGVKRGRRQNDDQDDDDDDDDDDEGEARSAIDEARTALGDVVPDYSGLPGFTSSANTREKKQGDQNSEALGSPDRSHDEDRQRHHSADKHASRGLQSDADPIEALSQADPTLAFNAAGEEDDAKSRQHMMPSSKTVSMDTLRKLAEENRLSGPGISNSGDLKASRKVETSSNSGKSKSGGFRNFLQLAPSTVYTDAELEEQPDDEYDPPPPPSEAARPPSVVPEDERETDDFEASHETHRPDGRHGWPEEIGKPSSSNPPSDNLSLQEQRSDGTAPPEDGNFEDEQEENRQASNDENEQEPHDSHQPEDVHDGYNASQSSKRKGQEASDDFDFNAFMFPLQAEEKRRKGTHLDSPGLSDTDPATKDAFSMITGQRKSKKDETASADYNHAASDTFLPGAASDASVRMLPGSVVQRMHQRDSETDIHSIQEESEVQESRGGKGVDKWSYRPRPPPKPRHMQVSTEDVSQTKGVNSTSTELGLAELEDDAQSKHSVAPGPQWRGAAPPPGSTSQHTANLRHEHLRWQRQQALQSQRNRIQQQRAQGGRRSDDRDETSHLGQGNGNNGDVPAPLARGAAQRPPFPPKGTAASHRDHGGSGERNNDEDNGAYNRRPGPMRQNTVSDHPAAERGGGWRAAADLSEGQREEKDRQVPQQAVSSAGALPSPVDPKAQTEYSPSPANATWNTSGLQGMPEQELEDELQVPATPKGHSKKELHNRQQEARVQAGAAATRRREILRRVAQRNEHAKNLLKSFINIINGGEAPMAENDFMRLSREAFRECARDNEALLANGGDGRAHRPAPGGRLPSSKLGKSAALRADQPSRDQDETEGDREQSSALPNIILNGED